MRLRSRDLSYFSRLEPARFERARGRRGTDARAPPAARGRFGVGRNRKRTLLFFFFFVSSAANRFAVAGALIVLVEGYSLRSAPTGKGGEGRSRRAAPRRRIRFEAR